MSSSAEPCHTPYSQATILELEGIYNRFETAWRSNQPPRIEDFLGTVAEPERPALLRELLAIEVAYRRVNGDDCGAEEYRARFPGLDAACLAEALAEEAAPADGAGCRYQALRFHAQGGLGEVHIALDRELGREVALKRMRDQYQGDPAGYQRFRREAEITAQLEHPGVVPVHGLVHDRKGRPCYAMRFIEGESLKDALRRLHAPDATTRPDLALRQLLTRLVTVCQTVAYAHSRGVIHRDLKPANIMLGAYGETLVVDWGLAQATGKEAGEWHREAGAGSDRGCDELTGTRQALGTPAYMSPEQAEGRTREVGPTSDVFSLGATLYAVLTGRAPYPETRAGEPLPQTRPRSFPRPRQVKPDAPRALEAVCLKAMAWRPEDRYASALAMAADLERWLAGEVVAAYSEPWRQRLGRWMKRRRTLVAVVASLVLGLIPVLVTLLLLLERERARTDQERQAAQDNAARAVLAMKEARKAVLEMGYTAQAGVRSPRMIRRQNLRVARRTFGGFLQQYPDEPGLLREVAEFHFHFGWVCMEIGDWPEAIGAYQEALDHYGRMRQAELARWVTTRQALCWNDLGRAYHAVGEPTEAEPAFRRALQLQEQVVRESPELMHQANLAEIFGDWGVFLRDVGRPAEAAAALRTALTWWEATAARAAEREDARRGQTCGVGLVLTLAHLGEFTQAEAHLPDVERLLPGVTREDLLYDVARAYALLSADRGRAAPADHYKARAVATLRRALDRDFINLDCLRRDPDLDALRENEEFQQLVHSLEERVRAGFR